jgi:hypothetical protein
VIGSKNASANKELVHHGYTKSFSSSTSLCL